VTSSRPVFRGCSDAFGDVGDLVQLTGRDGDDQIVGLVVGQCEPAAVDPQKRDQPAEGQPIETGVRWGELAALRPVDIDLETGEIHIRRVVLEVTKKITGADKVWTIRDYPKDNEHRTIRVGDQLCQDIREYQMATGRRGDDLLFSTSTGSPVSRNVFRTRVWLPAVARSKFNQRVRFHDLRGAHASWLLAGGADLKAVMDRLGHKQIQTTQQYLGRLPDADDRALAAFESIRSRKR
jgi:integrase